MKIYCAVLLAVLFVFDKTVWSQNFNPLPLITIPGDNTDFDVYSNFSNPFSIPQISNLVWLNKYDSTYTIYFKQISPSGNNVVVASGRALMSSPHISNNKIEWQTFENNKWKIFARSYSEDILSDTITCIDSAANNPQADINDDYIVWINNGSLWEEKISAPASAPLKVDSLNCSSPVVGNYDFYGNTILYIKNFNEYDKLYYAENISFPKTHGDTSIIIDSAANITNPNLGYFGSIAYQVKTDSVWRINYSPNIDFGGTTANKSCNYQDPEFFTYPMLTKRASLAYTPFFIVYDSDSLNHKNVYIRTVYFNYGWEPVINISNFAGNDYNPKMNLVLLDDSMYVAIFWNHTQNNKTDIWIGKYVYQPDLGAVENTIKPVNNFQLYQNYPNPFNPETVIKYDIPKSTWVTITIYDVLGREVKELVDEYKSAGSYEVKFNSSKNNFSSGVYFYMLQAGNYNATKKMLILK